MYFARASGVTRTYFPSRTALSFSWRTSSEAQDFGNAFAVSALRHRPQRASSFRLSSRTHPFIPLDTSLQTVRLRAERSLCHLGRSTMLAGFGSARRSRRMVDRTSATAACSWCRRHRSWSFFSTSPWRLFCLRTGLRRTISGIEKTFGVISRCVAVI